MKKLPNCHEIKEQNGVALITAMMITAIAVAIASTMIYKHQVHIRLIGNINHSEQAFQFVTGMEAWASVILSRDRKDNDYDSLDEDWAQGHLLPPTAIPGGMMHGELEDLQGRFNLNNLITEEGKTNKVWKKSLITLLQTLELPEGLNEPITDWIDPDQNTSGAEGAESDYYLSMQPPHFAADSRMITPTELKPIKDMNAETYNTFAPFVSTLPKTTPINVNTASKEVLISLGLTDSDANAVIEEREESAYEIVNDFISTYNTEGNDISADTISVNSQYFVLKGKVQINKINIVFNTVLQRDNNGQVHAISREFESVYRSLPKEQATSEDL